MPCFGVCSFLPGFVNISFGEERAGGFDSRLAIAALPLGIGGMKLLVVTSDIHAHASVIVNIQYLFLLLCLVSGFFSVLFGALFWSLFFLTWIC